MSTALARFAIGVYPVGSVTIVAKLPWHANPANRSVLASVVVKLPVESVVPLPPEFVLPAPSSVGVPTDGGENSTGTGAVMKLLPLTLMVTAPLPPVVMGMIHHSNVSCDAV